MDLGAPRTSAPSISAVLPAYNEAPNLGRTIGDLARALRSPCADFEIIIVDDGSTDNSAAVASQLAATIPEVVLVSHPHNQGYGAALRTGFRVAHREWVLLLDADGQFEPREIDRFLHALPQADLVLGYRARRADPPHRRIYAACWRLLMRWLLGVRVRDLNCGFKLMRRALLQSLALTAEGAFISTELLAKAHRQGVRFVEVPVTHRPRLHGRQTGGDPRVLLQAFYELGKLWWKIRQSSPDARGS